MTRDFGEDVFAGAAFYYAKYRPRYPQKLYDDIAANFKLDGRGQLLDLGCGTGELALPLAKYFKKVLALDPDIGMLAAGRDKAKKQGIANVTWQKGSSKELISLEDSFRLVTMGQSFHWMDQETVLEELYPLVEEGGALAIIGAEPVDQGLQALEEDKIIKRCVSKYLGPDRRAGSEIYIPPPHKYEELLAESRFKNLQQQHYDLVLTRGVDKIIGHLFSMSWALKSHFGDQLQDFENELRQELRAISTNGKITEKVRFGLYTVTKRCAGPVSLALTFVTYIFALSTT